jgi:hypothetical protein
MRQLSTNYAEMKKGIRNVQITILSMLTKKTSIYNHGKLIAHQQWRSKHCVEFPNARVVESPFTDSRHTNSALENSTQCFQVKVFATSTMRNALT